MTGSITTEQVWEAIDDAYFDVLAFVNRNGHPRTAGVCYVVDARSLYISTDDEMRITALGTGMPNLRPSQAS
ncbi:MAG: hypothetical protein QNJ71_08695, partial [Acidimicrobiia bacterium]|nr:hypothetical protein [Acidimicrobiia bacterium]